MTDVAPDSLHLAEPIVRLSVAQYRRMAEAHVFGPDDEIELLEGVTNPRKHCSMSSLSQ